MRKELSMNLLYLPTYLSFRLHTIVRLYGQDGSHICFQNGRSGLTDLSLYENGVEKYLLAISENDSPCLLTVNDSFSYSCVLTGAGRFVIGPVRLDVTAVFRHLLTVKASEKDFSGESSVPVCSYTDFLDGTLLPANLLADPGDSFLTENDILKRNSPDLSDEAEALYTSIVFNRNENEKPHNPYDQEVREQRSIETGDIELFKSSIAEEIISQTGVLDSKDKLRNYKDLAIVVITLASRSAIRGGLPPEISFSMSDGYINEIERCLTAAPIYPLIRKAELTYLMQVREIKEKRTQKNERHNPCIDQCKNYVFSHLHSTLFVKDIADALNINADYLSSLFKKSEGIGLAEYILREKLKLVKNMLAYSDYSYSDIANYLGFASQSHLGRLFKKNEGMTLREYRLRYGRNGFK